MASNKVQYRSIQELNNPSIKEELAHREFSDEIPVEEFLGNSNAMNTAQTNRRDFLKILGFSTAAVTLAACEAPVIKSVPFVVKPDGIIPGIPNYYASTFYDGFDFANVLVKTREGRPIKIDSNKGAKFFNKTNPRTQASVLSLYDNNRIKNPSINGEITTWDKIDEYVKKALAETATSGKKIILLTPSFPSPSTAKLLQEFKTKYPTFQQVVFDAFSASPALDAAQESFGQRVLPLYDLSNTQLIVSFNADFLNDFYGNSLEESYAKAKKPSDKMIRHIQVEGNMSMTGASADRRYPVKPSAVYKILAEVYTILNGGSGSKEAKEIAKELSAKGSNAVVLADGNKEAHNIANAINQKLASNALIKDKAILLKQSDDIAFTTMVNEMQSGAVGMVINFETNPVYAWAKGKQFEQALSKVKHTVALTQKNNETTQKMKVVAPVPHWLESWGDFNPVTGVYTLQQPAIQRIFDTRQLQDSLLQWMETSPKINVVATESNAVVSDTLKVNTAVVANSVTATNDYYSYLKNFWQSNIIGKVGKSSFNKALYEGCNVGNESVSMSASTNADAAVAKFLSNKGSDFELQLYTKVSLGDGTQANNPWLQELPDPITRTSWDNFLLIHPDDAEKLDLLRDSAALNGRMQLDGSVVKIIANGVTLNVPAFIQPGQAKGCLGLALGYGQNVQYKDNDGNVQVSKVAQTGVNAYPLFINSTLDQYNVSISNTGDTHEFACMQLQNTLMGRYEIAREVNLKTYLEKDVEEWNKPLEMHSYGGALPIGKIDLWDEFDSKDGPHFNLSVDMNSCTGCGACIIACQAENNVAVVGKDEMRMNRDMYWLRIDRYYNSYVPKSADENHDGKLSQEEAINDNYIEPQQYCFLETPAKDNPDVIFQPVMCQHCNHASCETVCPVAATSHGKQGQNQMAYNRCVGTRYCANNCPYKVRRFNWLNYALNDKFDFNMNNDLGRMVLNPDVVVRTRGVMEKCSMCIQMTQATIIEAKKEGRAVKDGEFQTACTKACATQALQFGDVNDKSSAIRNLAEDKRKYILLEDVGTKPNVFYHYKVRNNKV